MTVNRLESSDGQMVVEAHDGGALSLIGPNGLEGELNADGIRIGFGAANWLAINPDGSVKLGGPTTTFEFGTDGSVILVGAGGGLAIRPDGTPVFHALQTTDPADTGALWNDNGTVKVSAG